MSVIETLRELSEVWRLFSDMPDDATLNVELASLYLGISVKSLARYRQNGGGPQYIQYQSEDSKARNQRINYLLRDLRSWRDDHCSGQLKLATALEFFQYRFSDSFGGNPPLYSCGLSAL